jgi:hypothetical protein
LGTFYCEDSETHKQASLKTKIKAEATRIIAAKNEAHHQPMMNLQIARPTWRLRIQRFALAPGGL